MNPGPCCIHPVSVQKFNEHSFYAREKDDHDKLCPPAKMCTNLQTSLSVFLKILLCNFQNSKSRRNLSLGGIMKATLLGLALFLIFQSPDGEAKYKGRLVPGKWQQSWNNTLKANIYTDFFLNHKDSMIDSVCRGYRSSQTKRKAFWHQLFVSLAYKESLHGPGNYVYFNGGINKGLYQVNPVLKKAYGCSGDLYNPHNNIRCGANIARKLIRKYGSFLSGSKGGMAAYWQPLRASSSYNRKNRAWILNHVTRACSTHRIAYHSTSAGLKSLTLTSWEADLNFNDVSELPLEDLNIILQDPLSFRPLTLEDVEAEAAEAQWNYEDSEPMGEFEDLEVTERE